MTYVIINFPEAQSLREVVEYWIEELTKSNHSDFHQRTSGDPQSDQGDEQRADCWYQPQYSPLHR